MSEMHLPSIFHHLAASTLVRPLVYRQVTFGCVHVYEYIALLSEELFVTSPKDLAVKADEGLPTIHSGRAGDWWRKTDSAENPARN